MVESMAVVAIREYDAERDRVGAEAVERMCEVGHSGGAMSLFTDLLGDPLCRVRHSPPFLMLVAELVSGPERAIVGLVRGCIKTVACGSPLLLPSPAKHHTAPAVPIYAKVAYLLGLRVSPAHRRRGIALKLVRRMEEWFKEKGAEYAYMATKQSKQAGKDELNGMREAMKKKTGKLSNKDKKRLDAKQLRAEGGGEWRKGKSSEADMKARHKEQAKSRAKGRATKEGGKDAAPSKPKGKGRAGGKRR